MKIGISGGTGLVGKALTQAILERGDEVVIFTRNPEKATKESIFKSYDRNIVYKSSAFPKPDGLEGLDVMINLAGENLAGVRWTKSAIKRFYDSRVGHTQQIVQAMKLCQSPPKIFLSASAIGFYGSYPMRSERFSESSSMGDGILADLSFHWEEASKLAQDSGIRVINPRIGIVLDRKGGALGSLIPIFKSFAGGPLGSGKQGMSWIHIDDIVGGFLFLIDHKNLQGAFNLTAPNPVSNEDFSNELGKALHRPSAIWTPSFILNALFGEGAKVVTEGQMVYPDRLIENGYKFKFSNISHALESLL
ncbi:TIGR01777 family oxidoreductase [Leptospira sp. GIMC2001]|uniref:TIGR01777 family oxidoreductase n=1 Tax=Leptospira sp. GIMC2001 TaxID=1513297 RepID=UPI00234A62F5|nr:TIGR01777 family oxidoreductase [Leptospira sp. GIMC2001]WCL48583.1 TIGR01777 family oxidoreductase [Leptospira sp. GIMC2001]